MSNFQRNFTHWLNSDVYLNHGTDHVKRHYFLRKLIDTILINMKKEGYSFCLAPNELVHSFFRLVFYTHEKRRYTIPQNEQAYPEDYDWYLHVLGDEWWDSQWERWEQLGDFFENPLFSAKIRGVLPLFMWTFVDIANSRATSMGDDSETEEDGGFQKKKHIDPYVLDQMSRSGTTKAGRWE
jgi:hypothetical protein